MYYIKGITYHGALCICILLLIVLLRLISVVACISTLVLYVGK